MMNREKLMRLAERVLKRTEAYQENRGDDVPDKENYKMAFLLRIWSYYSILYKKMNSRLLSAAFCLLAMQTFLCTWKTGIP